jgi:hypothetical protein
MYKWPVAGGEALSEVTVAGAQGIKRVGGYGWPCL